MSSQGLNLSICLDDVSFPRLASHRSSIPISPEFFKLLDSKKATQVFRETKKLGSTFLISDEDEIKRLVGLETRERKLRSTRI